MMCSCSSLVNWLTPNNVASYTLCTTCIRTETCIKDVGSVFDGLSYCACKNPTATSVQGFQLLCCEEGSVLICYNHKKLLDIEPLSKCLGGISHMECIYCVMHYLYIYHSWKEKETAQYKNTDLLPSCPSHRVYGNPATPPTLVKLLLPLHCKLAMWHAISHTEAEAFSTSDLQFGSKR